MSLQSKRFYLIALIILAWLVVFAVFQSRKITLPTYLPQAEPQLLSKGVNQSLLLRDFDVSFKFYINEAPVGGDVVRYEGLFQTANYNSGLRLEIARSVASGIRWALVFKKNSADVAGVDLGAGPTVGKWHNFEVQYRSKEGRLTIYMDEEKIRVVDNVNLSVSFDNVASGIGFDQTRKFDGVVEGFSINTKPDDAVLSIAVLVLALLTVLLFFGRFLRKLRLCCLVLLKGLVDKRRLHKTAAVVVLALLAALLLVKIDKDVKAPDYIGINHAVALGQILDAESIEEIGFDFYIDPIEKPFEGVRYENLFQTADWNEGFRLEIARKYNAASFFGVVYTDTKDKVRVVELGSMPSVGRWNNFRLNYSRSKNRVDVFVNGVNLASYGDADVRDPLIYSCK